MGGRIGSAKFCHARFWPTWGVGASSAARGGIWTSNTSWHELHCTEVISVCSVTRSIDAHPGHASWNCSPSEGSISSGEEEGPGATSASSSKVASTMMGVRTIFRMCRRQL